MMNSIKKLRSSFFIKTEYISPVTKNLEGQTVIITGATGGIGRAMAEVLHKEGANLVLVSRSISKDESLADLKQDRLLLVDADITKKSDIENVVTKATQQFSRINVLINNAGQFADKSLEDFTEEEYDKVMNTNVKGMFLFSQAVLPAMKKNNQGLIINIGSKISHNTNISPHKVLYAMSKYAVEGFSFALNKELKPYGVRVCCLMPGTVNTFVSLKSKDYLSPYDLGTLVAFIIKNKEIDFESFVFKSLKQDI